VIQQTDYDPFGLVTDESIRENTVQNDFLYNGKELQKDFDLNWYDYGARMYDAALGRWHVIDPMAEKYSNWSPYSYVLNNPLKFTDTDGRDAKHITPVPREIPGIIKKMPSGIGNHIVAGVENNHKIKVIIAYQPENKFTKTSDGHVPGGRTLESLGPEQIHKDPKTGKITIAKIPGEFDIFAGQDITADIKAGRAVYLVAIARIEATEMTDVLANAAQMTDATLHELAAHANSDQAAVKKEMDKCHCSRGEAEHNIYGSAFSASYFAFKDGKVDAYNDKISDGTTAEQVQEDILIALSRELAKRIKEMENARKGE
jgi:RHS repeat-associated protein